MVVTGIITALAFIAITVQFVVAMVESYIIVAAAFIFVGFGGSRWTAPYVERYIGLGVSNGVKIMLLYLLIGTGMQLSVDWMTQAENIASNSSPAMSALEIMGASIIFMMLCWQIPKLFSAVLGGSPALTGGDLVGTSAFLAGSAVAVGSMAATGVGSAVAGVRACRRRLVVPASAGATGSASGGASFGDERDCKTAHTSSSSGSTSGNSVPPPSASASRSKFNDAGCSQASDDPAAFRFGAQCRSAANESRSPRIGIQYGSSNHLNIPNLGIETRSGPTKANAPENPYLAARREWDERYGHLITRERNWRRHGFRLRAQFAVDRRRACLAFRTNSYRAVCRRDGFARSPDSCGSSGTNHDGG